MRQLAVVGFAFGCAIACSTAPAVEFVGDPPAYLGQRYRADWRMAPLTTVLDGIAAFIEKPVVRSEAVRGRAAEPVLQIDEKKVTLREALELLEATQRLHFIAEPLRLRVETDQDARDSRRRAVNLHLSDFGSFISPRDFPGEELAFPVSNRGGGGFDLFGGASMEPEVLDPQDVLDLMRTASSGGDMQLRGGNVFLLVTPEEEVAMRERLTEQFARISRRCSWKVTFGILAADQSFATGLVADAEATAIAARLTSARTLLVGGMSGQRVSARDLEERSIVSGIEVVGHRHDPVVEILRLGRVADIRALAGLRMTMVDFSLRWAEPIGESRMQDVRRDAGSPGIDLSGTLTLEQKDDKHQNGGFSLTGLGGGIDRGQTTTLELPELWTWQPRGEVFLPPGTSLVLSAGHPAGRAVIVMEATP